MSSNKERVLIVAAFAAIYFIWGSTYLANWYAIQDMPPFLMSGARFVTAGVLLYLFTMVLGQPRPTRRNWVYALLSGTLFLAIGTGGVVWAEQFIDSSMAALMIGAEPVVIVLLMWLLNSKKPTLSAILGVSLGLVGMYILVGQPTFIANRESLMGLVAIAISMLAWGVVSVKLNDFDLPQSRMQSSSMQMLGGGAILFLFSAFSGETSQFAWANLSSRGIGAWFFLVFLGSIVAFSAFNYLLTKVSPDKVATANYVNPIVALLLGWGLNNEEVSGRSLFAAAILIFSVFLINTKWAAKFYSVKHRKMSGKI